MTTTKGAADAADTLINCPFRISVSTNYALCLSFVQRAQKAIVPDANYFDSRARARAHNDETNGH